jgi:hypothetical protein
MTRIMSLGALLLLVACAGAEQKSEKRWEVKVSKQSEPKVWISKPDGSKQCGEAPASLTPSSASQALKEAGVMVFEGRNSQDGMMHPAVCGAATGNTVELEIFRSDLPKAQAMGFRPLPRQN